MDLEQQYNNIHELSELSVTNGNVLLIIWGLSVCTTTLLYHIVALFYCLTWSLLLTFCDVVCAVGLTVVHTETTIIGGNLYL